MLLRELVAKSVGNGIKHHELALKVGCSSGTISNILRGMKMALATYEMFAKYYNVSVDELRGSRPVKAHAETISEGFPPTYKKIPLLTTVQAGAFTDRVVPPYAGTADEYVETNMRGERIFALRVTGDSMEPLFRAGEVVIVNPDLQCDSGNYVVAKTPDHGGEEATIKQLKKYGDQLYLHPLNPKYDDILVTKKHKIVGKIVRKQMDF